MTETPCSTPHHTSHLAATALAALGVVYGDIGTSPLYAFAVAQGASAGAGLAPAQAALGIASLIVWSLMVIISLKYAILILRADNHGEGGIAAMLALLGMAKDRSRRGRILLVVGLIGAALLYGDGAITPAISVLSAVEGLKLLSPLLSAWVLPLTLVILLVLFTLQSKGTAFISRLFGPVMLCWFVVIGLLGAAEIVRSPAVIAALNPMYAAQILQHGSTEINMAIVGGVFLAVTGGEAMYADLGHFGRRPIRWAWFAIVLPALILNYLGQAALVIRSPGAATSPFYLLAPPSLHYPLVAFATCATVIAAQAIISGIFSLTHQSIQLGFLPRLQVRHTGRTEIGQIYVPVANWALLCGTISAVLLFGSSTALAGAYGIAVSGLMAITTTLAGLVASRWGYPWWVILSVNGTLLAIDLLFFGANAAKLLAGGWFPLLIAGVVAFLMLTWREGRGQLEQARDGQRESKAAFLQIVTRSVKYRRPGLDCFLGSTDNSIPLPLMRHVELHGTLRERVVIVSVVTSDKPFVPHRRRTSCRDLGQGIACVRVEHGFMELPNVPKALHQALPELDHKVIDAATYYLGHDSVTVATRYSKLTALRLRLFAAMHRLTSGNARMFGIVNRQVVVIGTEIAL